jgi:membrane associated rhomboid family serine protease
MGDLSHFRKRPLVTLIIIAVNIAVYAITTYENIFLEVSDYWVSAGGFVPALISMPLQWYRIFTSMFLHADFFHILFNMYFLYIFGRAVENVLGGLRFLALYMVSGIVASIFHTAFSFLGGATAYVIPAIGASGAISGVLGAYLILFPGTSLVMGWGFLFFPIFFRLKAAYYLIFWFATQVIYGFARLGGSTAVFAHAGGFIAGIALLPLVANKERFIQFKLARQAAFPTYVMFTATPAKTTGLGRTTKAIVAVLLASLLFGTAYASTGLASRDNAKWVTLQYTCEGTAYTDSIGISLSNIGLQLASISLDTTRVMLNRLYAAGMLYNASNANSGGFFNFTGQVRIGNVKVPTVIILNAQYDSEGFLKYGEGNLTTFVVYDGEYLGPPVSYSFEIASQTMNLTYVTQYTGIISLVVTAAALSVTIKKDRDLALIGEEPRRVWRPFTPVA